MEKSSTPTLPAAAPIPLPTSHIKRTHSELQLAQDQLLADYQDNQIYERIRKSSPAVRRDDYTCDLITLI